MGSIEVGSRVVDTTNEDKLLFPADGLSKGDLVRYAVRIADLVLPHLRNRPLVLERYPDGIEADGFLQKEALRGRPAWVRTATVPKEGGTVTHILADHPATLAYLADQGCVTLHAWLSRTDRPRHPDQVVFDLDPPGAGRGAQVAAVATALRELLDDLGVAAFVKSSGSRGAHVHVPVDGSADFDEARHFAGQVAAVLAERHPELVTVAQRKAERGDRLFIDTLRNAYAQHVVVPYAIRARPGAPVAVPLSWKEACTSRFDPQRITLRNVFRRLARKADPWAGWHSASTSVAEAARRLDARRG